MNTRYIQALIIVLLIVFLLGCNINSASNIQKISTIEPTKLNQRECELLTNVGIQHQLIFDVNVSGLNASSGYFWVDLYENGQFKGQLINLGSSISGEAKDTIYHAILAIQEPDSQGKQKWILSFANGRGSTTKVVSKGSIVTEVKLADKKSIEKGNDITIGLIVQDKQGTAIPNGYFENESGYMKELLKNESVYILRCRFK